MLGRRRTPKTDIVVAILGVLVVAITRAQVVRIVVVPGTAAEAPIVCDQSPFPRRKTTSSSTSFLNCIVFAWEACPIHD